MSELDTYAPPEDRLSFSKKLPGLQLAWDSTSLGALKTCPRYYQLNILQGFVSKIEGVHLRFGREFHAALELFDRLRAEGIDTETATLRVVRHMLISTWDEVLGRPWSSDEPTKTRESLVRSVIWYLEQFANDPLETIILANGQPAVELSFRFEIGYVMATTGEAVLICGHLDRGVKFQDRPWVADRKTTKSQLNQDFFAKFSPDNQMSLYSIAGTLIFNEPIAGIIIDAAQMGATFCRFQRAMTPRTKMQLDEWMEDLWFWLSLAETFAKANYWPMNDKSCNMYGGCPYRQICGASPEIRPALLKGLYHRRGWDPLQTREI